MLAELMNPCCGQFDLSFLRGAEYPKIEERDPFFPEKEVISRKRNYFRKEEIMSGKGNSAVSAISAIFFFFFFGKIDDLIF